MVSPRINIWPLRGCRSLPQEHRERNCALDSRHSSLASGEQGLGRHASHEGGSIVNRWHFSRTWMPMIENGLMGSAPTHALIQSPGLHTTRGLKRRVRQTQECSAEASELTKVLLISLYHPELVRGGAQQICYELFNALKSRKGIEPTLLAAVDPSFKSLYKVGAQITGFDGREGEFIYLSRGYDPLWHKNSSVELAKSYAEFLEIIQPDVVHFHHFHLLGIDLLTLTRRILPKVAARADVSRIHGDLRRRRAHVAKIRQIAVHPSLVGTLSSMLSRSSAGTFLRSGNVVQEAPVGCR